MRPVNFSFLKSILPWLCLASFAFLIARYGILHSFENTRGDFANYYTAARLVSEGVSVAPAYRDFVWFQKQMDRVGIRNQVGGFIPHPPSTALVFLPIVPFDAVTAKNIWTGFNIALLILNIVLLVKISGLDWRFASLIFLGTGYGLINNFLFGQLYLLVLTSILAGIFLQQRGRKITAGVALALLIPVKYVGVLFVAYYAWRREWKLVLAAAATTFTILLTTVALDGFEVFRTFVTEVMPRHLRGEIQDPFSIYFQSWNSLFRRLFVLEQTLNPRPPLPAPFLFYLLKNVVFWSIVGFGLYLMRNISFEEDRHQHLFRLALIPMILLLVSPGNTTYYFLLLTISTCFFAKILFVQNREWAALSLISLFIILNLPHFMELKSHATGWSNLIVYTRLWSQVLFFVVSIYLFRRSIQWRRPRPAAFVIVLGLIVSLTATSQLSSAVEKTDDSLLLSVNGPQFDRHLGLLLNSPSVGSQTVVFDYCELLNDRYAIYSADGQPWFDGGRQNFYNPALAPDDSVLLMETIVEGHSQIWISRERGAQPVFLRQGSEPSWHPDGNRFVFTRGGHLYLAAISGEEHRLSVEGICMGPAISQQGDRIAFSWVADGEWHLVITDLHGKEGRVLLQSHSRIESPVWSPDARQIVFSWNRGNNRDIWSIDIRTLEAHRLTHHRAIDSDPVWDPQNDRIIFTSDRGRGLEFSTLYWLPAPK